MQTGQQSLNQLIQLASFLDQNDYILNQNDILGLPSLDCRHGVSLYNHCSSCKFSKMVASVFLFTKVYHFYMYKNEDISGTNKKLLSDFDVTTKFKIRNFKQEDFVTIYEILEIVPLALRKTIINYLKIQLDNEKQ